MVFQYFSMSDSLTLFDLNPESLGITFIKTIILLAQADACLPGALENRLFKMSQAGGEVGRRGRL